MLSFVPSYEELGSSVDELKGQRGTKTAFVLRAIDRAVGDLSVAELHAKVPSVGLDLIRKILKDEKATDRVCPSGARPSCAVAEGCGG
jgi:hypothetical protein